MLFNKLNLKFPLGKSQGAAPAFNPLTDVTSGTLKFWIESDGDLYQDVARTTPATANDDPVQSMTDMADTPHHPSEATNPPILKTNVVGMLPGILFDGTDDVLATASFDTGIGTGAYTLFISVLGGAGLGQAMFARGTYDPAFYSRYSTSDVVGIYSTSGRLYNASLDSDPHVLTFKKPTSGRQRLYVDSVLDEADDAVNLEVSNWTAAALTIGGNGAGSQVLAGYLFAVGLYAGELSDADRVAVEDYLKKKLAHEPDPQAVAYVEQGSGALICYNMPTFNEADYGIPDCDPDIFAPTGLDIDQWLDACVSADMNYAILTVKHHDGFVIYPTAYHTPGHTPHSIAQTEWYANNGQIDIVAQFVTKCRTRGLNPGLYFSIQDDTFEVQTGTDETTNAAGYIAMIEAQLTELLTNYGAISSLWFDSWGWELGYEEIPYAAIYNLVKSLQPDCVVVENSHTHPTIASQVETYEQNETMIPALNLRPSEYVESIRTDSWFYFGAEKEGNLKDTAALIAARTSTNNNNGAWLLGISPATNGLLSAGQLAILAALGA